MKKFTSKLTIDQSNHPKGRFLQLTEFALVNNHIRLQILQKKAKGGFWLIFVPRSIQHKSQQIPTFSNQLKITTTHLRQPQHNPHFSTSQIFFLLKPTEKTVIFFYQNFLFTAFHSPLYTCLQKIVTFFDLLRSV